VELEVVEGQDGCRTQGSVFHDAGSILRASNPRPETQAPRASFIIAALTEGVRRCQFPTSSRSVSSSRHPSDKAAWFKSLGARVTFFAEGVRHFLAANAGGSGVCRRGGPRLYAGKCYPALNQADKARGQCSQMPSTEPFASDDPRVQFPPLDQSRLWSGLAGWHLAPFDRRAAAQTTPFNLAQRASVGSTEARPDQSTPASSDRAPCDRISAPAAGCAA
jgi:hypothetical protein